MDPFTADRHLVLALYCVGAALIVALLLLAALALDYVDELKNDNRRNKKGGKNNEQADAIGLTE